jgi:hypothetical protein
MPADSRVTQSFPLEKRSAMSRIDYRQNEQTPMTPRTMTARRDFSVLKSKLLDFLPQNLVTLKQSEQIRQTG